MLRREVKLHPVATIFPEMSQDEFEKLKADIEANGQRESIVYWNQLLIDGRHRLRACQELMIEPMECELEPDDDPVAYALSCNLHRRHLSTTQRGSIASKLATLKHGDNQHKKEGGQNCLSTEQASTMLNVSERTTKDAKLVHERGSKSLVEAMDRNEITASLAAKLVKAVPDKREQTKILSSGLGAVREAVKPKPKQNTEPKVTTPDVEWEDVEFDELEVCKLDEFKKFWSDCDDVAKAAIRIWIEEQMLTGATQ